tara:strand:+ start:343 stop:582 length:240 start_codon:yes stop_codon:yes gene_type:complete
MCQIGIFFFRINRDENELGSITSHCAKLGTPRGISIHWEINSRITQEIGQNYGKLNQKTPYKFDGLNVRSRALTSDLEI